MLNGKDFTLKSRISMVVVLKMVSLEFLSQSNDSANMIDEEEKFKFVDDLTLLEIINLLSIGMASFYVKKSVPTDLPNHIPAEH